MSIYESIFKIHEASNNQELHLLLKGISKRSNTVFQEISGKHPLDRKLILVELKEIRKKYSDQFFKFEFKGKSGFNVLHALDARIDQFEFDLLKKEGICNCLLRKQIRLSFDEAATKQLSLLKKVENAYERHDVYECRFCKELWVYDYRDGDDGGARWVPWNKDDFDYDL